MLESSIFPQTEEIEVWGKETCLFQHDVTPCFCSHNVWYDLNARFLTDGLEEMNW
jgi:hypothetical protein